MTVHSSSHKLPDIWPNLMKLEFPREIFESLYKILPDGVELLQSDGQTDMTKLTVGLSNFSKAFKIH
jgi:hypothetical protein